MRNFRLPLFADLDNLTERMDRNKTHFQTYIVRVYIRVFSVVCGIFFKKRK